MVVLFKDIQVPEDPYGRQVGPPLGAILFQNILSIGASAASIKHEPGSNFCIYSPAEIYRRTKTFRGMLEAAALLMLFIFLEAYPADPPKDLPTDDYHFHTKKDTSVHQGCLPYIILRAWG